VLALLVNLRFYLNDSIASSLEQAQPLWSLFTTHLTQHFMLTTIFKVIAPDECAMCGVQGTLLCAHCTAMAMSYVPSRCFHCMRPTADYAQCDVCSDSFAVDSVWVCGVYRGQLKQLIHDYKFLHKRSAANDLARILDTILPVIDPKTIIANVPTASSRIRERGFDHSALLAKTFAHKRGLVYLPCLARVGQTRQLGLGKSDRLQNIKGAVHCKYDSRILNAQFLVLDDVITTGASMNEAAIVLKKVGAHKVNAAVIAQTVI